MGKVTSTRVQSGTGKPPVTDERPYIFTEEEVAAIAEYGAVLGRIRKRLLREGYIHPDGSWNIFKIAKPSMDPDEDIPD